MNRGCIKLRISVILIFVSFACFSQSTSFDTAGFYKHLVAENLLPEQIAFNRQMQKTHNGNKAIADSLFLNISLAYVRLGITDSSTSNLNKVSPKPPFSVPTSNTYLSLLILDKKYDRTQSFLDNYTGQQLPVGYNDAALSVKILERKPTMQDTNTSSLSSFMSDIKIRYEQPPHYSGFI